MTKKNLTIFYSSNKMLKVVSFQSYDLSSDFWYYKVQVLVLLTEFTMMYASNLIVKNVMQEFLTMLIF